MTSDDFDRIEALFDAAIALPAELRASYLDQHCDDPTVREQVESMLRADDQMRFSAVT